MSTTEVFTLVGVVMAFLFVWIMLFRGSVTGGG
jgi:hypothetical protein